LNSGKLLAKITEKWPAKILSVAAALIITMFYRMNTLEVRTFSIPLRVEGNEMLVPGNFLESTVMVNLRGEPNSIYPIPEGDIEAFIDLGRYTSEGPHRIPVQIRKKGSAIGVEPLEITVVPTEVSVYLEQKIRRSIPVFPVFSGTVAPDYDLTSFSIIPQSVTAEGPRSSINSLYEFTTDAVDLEGRYEDFSVFVNIVNNRQLINLLGNRMVEYRGTIRPIEREPTTSPNGRSFQVLDYDDGDSL